MKVNIVVDNRNSWFVKKVERTIKIIKKEKHYCSLYFEHKNIPNNSDVTFFLSCEKYIKKETRNKSRYNIVVHASDLPKGKGMSPATWQILKAKNIIRLTLFEVSDEFDGGDYYIKDCFRLDGTELIDEWQEKLYRCIEKMIIKFLAEKENLQRNKQKGKSTFYKRRTPNDSKLDINKSIKSQINLLRVVDNNKYPAFFYYKKHKYLIKIYKLIQ